jgi:hypothetical protein
MTKNKGRFLLIITFNWYAELLLKISERRDYP